MTQALKTTLKFTLATLALSTMTGVTAFAGPKDNSQRQSFAQKNTQVQTSQKNNVRTNRSRTNLRKTANLVRVDHNKNQTIQNKTVRANNRVVNRNRDTQAATKSIFTEKRNNRSRKLERSQSYASPRLSLASRNRNNRRHSNYNRSYYSPYQSHIGISFSFGTPGYSRHRWARSAYAFFKPSYTSYTNYQHHTQCERVLLDGWHRRRSVLISVLQCYNPWDGEYIIEGSERIVKHIY